MGEGGAFLLDWVYLFYLFTSSIFGANFDFYGKAVAVQARWLLVDIEG